MSSRKLRSRSQSVDRAGNVQSNMAEDSSTDLSQESKIIWKRRFAFGFGTALERPASCEGAGT